MKRTLISLALLALVAPSRTAQAQVEADPSKDYAITPEAGAWLICATPYVGPQARQLAHEMILELRSRYKLPAYLLDRGEEERRKQEEDLKRIKQQYDALNSLKQQYHEAEVAIPRRLAPRVQEQCAVLVGGYKDQDAAARALKDFKKLPPPSNERLCPILTQIGPAEKSGDGQKALLQYAYANPFPNAFVVPNPTLPREPKNEDKNDPFLKKLNAQEAYSLLKCHKQYTLLVAIFKGVHTFQSTSAVNEGFMQKFFGGNGGELLEASGRNAHNLAGVLRSSLRFEAYVLHMREGSAVTIGSFDRPDDPQIKTLEQALATRFKYDGSLQLLPQPMVMRVPHR